MARKKVEIQEDETYCVYEWYWLDTGLTCYVGEGTTSRAHEPHTNQPEMNEKRNQGLIGVRVIKEGLTKGGAQKREKGLIALRRKEGCVLYNSTSGIGSSSNISLDDIAKMLGKVKKTDAEKFKAISESIANHSAEKRPTPESIIKELLDGIFNSSGYTPHNKLWLNPVSRFGEFYVPIAEKIGYENAEQNLTMVTTRENIAVFFGNSDRTGRSKVHNIKVIEADFSEWEAEEEYDSIIMNPPFIKHGNPFIRKCADMLKPNGFLAVVMSPFWRSIGMKGGISKATYKYLRKHGGFHLIHMYSDAQAKSMFNQSIGLVDTFVWQKGAKINNTRIVNQDGVPYSCDLSKYPQAPPVMPSCDYDQYFDQTDGITWERFPADGGSNRNPRPHVFLDVTTGKNFTCCDQTVARSQGKKVIIDQQLKGYHIDDVGDVVVNDRYMFFFDTEQEKRSIIRALDFVIQNKHLFKDKSNAWIPGIKVV